MLAEATEAYRRDRYGQAVRMLRDLLRHVPDSADARELLGLALYREGSWKEAIRELARFEALTGSTDQLPVVADCERALGHHERVAGIWERLRHASPAREVLVEGRLVMAGSLADRGRLADAIVLLEAGGRDLPHPEERHLRQWYALADLAERAGDLPRARMLFRRVARHDPGLADSVERAAALG